MQIKKIKVEPKYQPHPLPHHFEFTCLWQALTFWRSHAFGTALSYCLPTLLLFRRFWSFKHFEFGIYLGFGICHLVLILIGLIGWKGVASPEFICPEGTPLAEFEDWDLCQGHAFGGAYLTTVDKTPNPAA